MTKRIPKSQKKKITKSKQQKEKKKKEREREKEKERVRSRKRQQKQQQTIWMNTSTYREKTEQTAWRTAVEITKQLAKQKVC